MRLRAVLLLLLACAAAIAITPTERILRLRDCTSMTITPTGKDTFPVFGRDRVRSLAVFFDVSASSVRDEVGGAKLYKLSFFRDSEKPTDVLWVKANGLWGFENEPAAYGKDPRIIRWIEKTLKG